MNFKQAQNITKFLVLILTTFISFFAISPLLAQAETAIDIESESAIIVDVETGKILYSKKPDLALPPASMTKMMTEYLVWEAIELGKIRWDDKVQISDYAFDISANPAFSGVGLRKNADYTVRSLYEAMAINSDNGTSIALAELIAGSEGEFVKLMNQKGEEMGLPNFKFVNSTGLENSSLGENYPEGTDPNGTNLLSAKSAALLAYHLVKDYPEALDISSIPQTEFDGHTITNWNRMLPHEGVNFKQFYYEGLDGLKTGFTTFAGYCFTGTAKVGDKRLITVVMKAESEEQRFNETAKLLDYGFKNFEMQEVFPEGYMLEDESTLPVTKGKEKEVAIETSAAFQLPVKTGEEENYSIIYHLDESKLNENGELTAPIEKGEKVGTAEIIYEGTDYGYIMDDLSNQVVDLVTVESVEKSNWFVITIQSIGEFFSNVYSNIVDMIKGWFK